MASHPPEASHGWIARRLVAAGLLLFNGLAFAQGDQATPDLAAGAVKYVADYERDFSALVGELHETQRVITPDGKVRKQRTLVADILLVKTGTETQSFRDVISIDGKPVRNRDERLRKLFIDGQSHPVEKQAQAIAVESLRYNIGIQRGLDTLMLPLAILHADFASGFHFERSPGGLTFTEVRSPTMVRSHSRGATRDMFLRGTFTLGADGAAVHAATLIAANDLVIVEVDVRYVEDAATRLLVPSASTEAYRSTHDVKSDRTEVESTFSNFRRFQVTVKEQIDLPPSP